MSRMTTVFAIIIGAVVAGACGSSTAPTPKLLVSITGPATYQGHDTIVSAETLYVCYGSMLASASGGKPGQSAIWGSGHYTFVVTATGHTSQGTIASAADFFDDGGPDLPTGTQVGGGTRSFSSGPFNLFQTFYYSTPEEQLDSATYNFACQ